MIDICIIPARKGSSRIINKNIKTFYNRPIIEYSIEAAQKSELFKRIIVSSNSKEICDIAKKMGVETHDRPNHIAENDVGMYEVINYIIKEKTLVFDTICMIYPCAPFITAEKLIKAYSIKQIYQKKCIAVDEYGKECGLFEIITNKFELNNNCRYVGIPYSNKECQDINTHTEWNIALKKFINLKKRGLL